METLECKRCGHKWIRRIETLPAQCPKCRNPGWNKERTNKRRVKED